MISLISDSRFFSANKRALRQLNIVTYNNGTARFFARPNIICNDIGQANMHVEATVRGLLSSGGIRLGGLWLVLDAMSFISQDDGGGSSGLEIRQFTADARPPR